MSDQMQRIAGIIPARWASTRLPGKPLADLGGRPLVLHVWDRCRTAGLGRVIIATDDERVAAVARMAGAEVVLTDPDLPSGTDRCAAVARELDLPWVINVQGDEPFIDPQAIRQVGLLLQSPASPLIATLIRMEEDMERLRSAHVVKVVRNLQGEALYFSRQLIPFQRDRDLSEWTAGFEYHTHIGIYGFTREALLGLADLPPSGLEQAEQLEQLRWLEHGFRIATAVTDYRAEGIDTLEDLERARNRIAAKG
jgi:3-deoxy-manno-octulosonate cytidylyltransferase (CMP-KDO synthetase)